jgi:GNAT superfamily N-acetyltransferase
MIQVRPLAPHEVALHRALRLEALTDAPRSFGDRLDAVSTQPAAYWEALTAAVTQAGRDAMFVAVEGGLPLGSVYAMRDRSSRDVARIGGLWVAPEHRGRGVGRALVARALEWAGTIGAVRAELWAPEHEPAAVALYARSGFRQTGRTRPFPRDPALRALEMTTDLPQRGFAA